jgi:hypothetical protein
VTGRDVLPFAIKDGFRYRLSLIRKGDIEEAIKKRKAGGEDTIQMKKKAKKLKEVYLVSKTKYYAEASAEELDRELVLDGLEDNSEIQEIHRIIQYKVRWVPTFHFILKLELPYHTVPVGRYR